MICEDLLRSTIYFGIELYLTVVLDDTMIIHIKQGPYSRSVAVLPSKLGEDIKEIHDLVDWRF